MKTITFMLAMMLTFTLTGQNLTLDYRQDGTIEKATIVAESVNQALLLNTEVLQINSTNTVHLLELTLQRTVPTEVGNLLRTLSENPIVSAVFLGCCPDDPDNHPDVDESLCVLQAYLIDTSIEAGGDIVFNADVTFRNCDTEVHGGGNFIVNVENGAEFNVGTDFCPATLTTEDANFFASMADFQTLSIKEYLVRNELPKGKEFSIYNVLGQKISKGITDNYSLNWLKKGVFVVKVEGYEPEKYLRK